MHLHSIIIHFNHTRQPSLLKMIQRLARSSVICPSQLMLCRRSLNTAAIQGKSTIDSDEVAMFNSMAKQWWDINSPEFGALHRMNAVRVPLIVDAISRAESLIQGSRDTAKSGLLLHGIRILDAGCGGGILSEVSRPADSLKRKLCYFSHHFTAAMHLAPFAAARPPGCFRCRDRRWSCEHRSRN